MTERKRVALIHQEWCETSSRYIEKVFTVDGIRQRCEFRDFPLTRESKEVFFPSQWRPDGILMTMNEHDPRAEFILAMGIPTVKLYPEWANDPFPTVCSDPLSMGRLALRHLQHLSFHNVALAIPEGTLEGTRMVKLMRRLCAQQGIQNFQHFEIPASSQRDFEPGSRDYVKLEKAIKDLPRPFGLLTLTSEDAIFLCNFGKEIGIKIPGEAGILAPNDTINTQFCDPPLTALVPDSKEIATKGMEMLEALMAGEKLDKKVIRVPVSGLHARSSTLGDDPIDRSIERIRQIIQERACEGITVEELLGKVDMSRPTLEKRYRELTGVSPAQDIRRIRAEKASELLTRTDIPVAKVARQVGFDDPRPFMVFFKREFGATPGSYRVAHS